MKTLTLHLSSRIHHFQKLSDYFNFGQKILAQYKLNNPKSASFLSGANLLEIRTQRLACVQLRNGLIEVFSFFHRRICETLTVLKSKTCVLGVRSLCFSKATLTKMFKQSVQNFCLKLDKKCSKIKNLK